MEQKRSAHAGKRLGKTFKLSLLLSLPLSVVACEQVVEEDYSAYDECLIEQQELGVELYCEDDDSEWYKAKGYKTKMSKSSKYSSSRSGYGSSGYSSGG